MNKSLEKMIINIQEEINQETYESLIINCHYKEEDSTISDILRFLYAKYTFSDEVKIIGSYEAKEDYGVPIFFKYNGQDISGLVIHLLVIGCYSMVEFNCERKYEEREFRKYDIVYSKKGAVLKFLEEFMGMDFKK